MTEIPLQIENNTKDVKLHSSKAISGATFLGGPLAAGYLIRENFNALKKPIEGRNALIIGIVTTIALFGFIFMIPENILDKIPNQIIPLIYTGIIWGIVEWLQGKDLEKHKENGNTFFSGWRAAGVGAISLVIIAIGLFIFTYTKLNNPVYDIYDEKMAEFSKNEVESMQFFEKTAANDNKLLLNDLNYNVLPKWDENIKIMQELIAIEDMPSEFINQNEKLLEYSKLRLKAFLLIKKILIENTDKYDSQLNFLNLKIDQLLDQLNED